MLFFNRNIPIKYIKSIFQLKYIFGIIAIFIVIFISKYVAEGNIKYAFLPVFLFFFLIILIEPLLGLIFSIPLVLYFSYLDVLWISPWNYLIIFLATIVILALFLKGKIKINKYSRRIWVTSVLFLFWAIVISLIQGVEFARVVTYSLKLISVFLVGFCTMFFIKNEKQLRVFSYSLITFISISAFVGVMQFLGIDFFWKLREFLGINPNSVVGQQILQRSRVPGLAYFSIPFGYQLTSVVPLIFGILSVEKRWFLKNISLSLALGLCFLALLATLSKSAIIGGIVGLLVVRFLASKPKRRKGKVISLAVALSLLILILNTLTNSLIWENFSKPTSSTLSRIPLFLAAFKIFLNNPFGVGVGQFNKYGAEFFPELSHFSGAYYILTTSAHNQFLNILVYFGIFGLLLLILFYYYIFKGLFRLYRQIDNLFVKGITIGLIGSFTAYIINSMFHNAGPFMIDPFNWYFIGIAMFLFNNYSKFRTSKKYEAAKS